MNTVWQPPYRPTIINPSASFPLKYEINRKIDVREHPVKPSIAIKKVVFERWNDEAKTREDVHVHWTEAFNWADHDPCGGLGLTAVVLENGFRCFASGRYLNADHPYWKQRGIKSGLTAVVVGPYGDTWLERALVEEK